MLIKNIYSFFVAVALCLIAVVPISAQTVVWQIPLSSYNDIVRISSNLFQVSENGKIGLVALDGRVVLPIECDRLSDYYEHKALALTNDKHGERVVGCLLDNGEFHLFSKRYYTLNGQKFYSDGLLSVSDENNKLGYIDDAGNAVVGFDGKYDKIKPFSEGFAAVFSKKKYSLIDKDGTSVHFLFDGVGEVYGGTNVYQNEVYVWDTNGKVYTYNTLKRGVCKSAHISSSNYSFDYLYRFSSVTKCSKKVPYKPIYAYVGAKGLQPYAEGGLYGFKQNAEDVVACQFASASAFEDDLSVVTLRGKKGVLRYIGDGSFEIVPLVTHHNYYAGQSVTCKFKLNVPKIWDNKDLQLVVKSSKGEVDYTSEDDTYSIVHTPIGSQITYTIEVYGEGLKLYENAINYQFTKKEKCGTCGKDKDVCSFHGNHPAQVVKHNTPEPTKHKKTVEKRCTTCGKLISECKYKGVH